MTTSPKRGLMRPRRELCGRGHSITGEGKGRRCRQCHSDWQQRWAAENPAVALRQARERARRGLAFVSQLKAQPCADCGGTFPPECMDFDHRPGVMKVDRVGHMHTRTLDKVLAEIAKCDLVCANCHRIRTKTRRTAVPAELTDGPDEGQEE